MGQGQGNSDTAPAVTVLPMTTAQVLDRVGLGRAWAPTLEKELRAAGAARGRRWDTEVVTGWHHRMVAASDMMTARQYRVVAMCLESFPPAAIRERAGSSMERSQLGRLALVLALRYAADLAPMRPGRAGHRLVRDALNWDRKVPAVVRREVERAWLAGSSRADITAATGVGPTRLQRVVAALPPRLSTGDVTARFGWSPDNVFQKLSRGTFPAHDGVEGELRWWWPATVEAWEASKDLIACPQCGARVERLRSHSKAHRSST